MKFKKGQIVKYKGVNDIFYRELAKIHSIFGENKVAYNIVFLREEKKNLPMYKGVPFYYLKPVKNKNIRKLK